MENHLLYLTNLSCRFHGVDLQARRGGSDWPANWRVRLVTNKNERIDFRVEAFGDTPEEAIQNLKAKVDIVETPWTEDKFGPRMVDGKMVVPIWKTFTSGPDEVVGWMPFDPDNPKAKYFA